VSDVTITKFYDDDEFPVPAVAFDISSEREDRAMVRLVDTVPDGVPPEDLGFHPDYGSDHWSVEDGDAVFERRLDPDEEYQTVYGIRTSDHDPERFMTEPSIDVRGLSDDTDTEDADEATATPGRDSSQAARDVITGEGDVAGLDDADDTVDDIDISGTETTDTAEATETGDETESEAGMTVPDGGVGAALAAELREGDLSETDRELLMAELTEDDAGNEVRLTHLQSRISDLEAYTDALEDFIDENGPARQLIEDMTDQLETIETELDDVDNRTAENRSDIDRLDGRTEENQNDIEALEEDIADVESEISETQESVADLREDITEINSWRTRISTVLGGVPEDEDDQS
jgi:archaellum component FlaC